MGGGSAEIHMLAYSRSHDTVLGFDMTVLSGAFPSRCPNSPVHYSYGPQTAESSRAITRRQLVCPYMSRCINSTRLVQAAVDESYNEALRNWDADWAIFHLFAPDSYNL